jgi:hypothetical protein
MTATHDGRRTDGDIRLVTVQVAVRRDAGTVPS